MKKVICYCQTISFISFFFLFLACSKETPNQEKFELYVDYWNDENEDPSLVFNESRTSQEVKVDFSTTFTGVEFPPNGIEVLINNIRIINLANTNYEINCIQAFEFRNESGDWKRDVEFTMDFEQIQDLDVMLILDASTSLGADFTNIQGYAIDLISRIFEESPFAEVGIVSFSDVIDVLPPNNDPSTIINFIENIQQGQFTALYDGMSVAIDTLQARPAKGKAILTFTDGTDNFSSPENTPQTLFTKLVDDPNSIKINSFTIGLEGNGGTDRTVLENLAANGGSSEFPEKSKELEDVFDRFSAVIANVYDLSYKRSANIIPQADAINLRFDIMATPKQ